MKLSGFPDGLGAMTPKNHRVLRFTTCYGISLQNYAKTSMQAIAVEQSGNDWSYSPSENIIDIFERLVCGAQPTVGAQFSL